ncbi:unnamed protein product, partial [Arabidopsis halleri]
KIFRFGTDSVTVISVIEFRIHSVIFKFSVWFGSVFCFGFGSVHSVRFICGGLMELRPGPGLDSLL